MEKTDSDQSGLRSLNLNKPSWLLPTLTDLDERMKSLLNTANEDEAGDTFAERAEWYYQKRPQLLALAQDLYNGYITLLDCCEQTKRKHKHKVSSSSQITYEEDEAESQISFEAESTLSYHQPPPIVASSESSESFKSSESFESSNQITISTDEVIIAELVTKSVEIDMLANQLREMEQVSNESSRKIELLKKLLELLELERKMVLNENLSLEYKVKTLLEEKRAISSEAMFMKRKASELARCLLQVRDDQRVCMLSQKIEHLQGQIYGLENRNKEYYQQLVERDRVDNVKLDKRSNSKNNGVHLVALVGCFQLEKLRSKKSDSGLKKDGEVKKRSKLWGKVKNMDMFMCGINPSS